MPACWQRGAAVARRCRCRLALRRPPSPAPSLFLKRLKQVLRIPVLALVDSDPYGLKILSVYMKGEWVWGVGGLGILAARTCCADADAFSRCHARAVGCVSVLCGRL